MSYDLPVLVLDTETGGLSSKDHSLLTVAGVAWTPDAPPRPLFSLMVKEEPLSTTPKAMQVNRLDLEQIKREGLSPRQTVEAIRYALDQHYGVQRPPLCLAGHNIGFDVGFMQRLYRLAKQDYKRDFSRKTLDTVTLFQFTMAAGVLPPGKADGDSMFRAFQIPLAEEHRHTALGDAWATALALSRMADLLRSGRTLHSMAG